MKNKFLSIVLIFFVFSISFLTILPLFHDGFFPMHDDTQVQRVFEMNIALGDGMFPVRWVNDLGYGYGYPLFNFYGPLAYYVGGFIAFFVSSLLATKIMIAIALVGSALSIYLFAKSFLGKVGGTISAILYVYAPYHALDTYVRGDIGELWAYLFIPLVFLGTYKLFIYVNKGSDKRNNSSFNYRITNYLWLVMTSLGFVGVILSHNLSAFMLAPFLVMAGLIIIFSSNDKLTALYYLVLIVIFTLGLSAFYWLPVFSEIKYTNVLSQIGGGANFRNNFVCLNQLWQSQWGFGGSAPGCIDGLSFIIGKIHLLLSIGVLILLPFLRKQKKMFILGIMSIVGLLISIFLMTSFSQFIWEKIPQMAFLQYPWRYLLFASFFSALLGGLLGEFIYQKQKWLGVIFGIVLAIGIVSLNLKYFQPQKYLAVDDSYLTSKDMLNWTTSKISDEYMPVGFLKPLNTREIPKSLVVISKGLSVQKESIKTQEKDITFTLQNSEFVPLNLAYFPGWKAYDNAKNIPIIKTRSGVKVYMSKGIHHLALKYEGSLVETIANSISLTSAVVLILGIIWGVVILYAKKST